MPELQTRKAEKKVAPKAPVLDTIIPRDEFLASIERSQKLAKALGSKAWVSSASKGNVTKAQNELGKHLGKMLASVRARAYELQDGLTKAKQAYESKTTDEIRKASNALIKKLGNAQRQVKQLNTEFGKAVTNPKGIDPKTVLSFLPELKAVYIDCDDARLEATKLYNEVVRPQDSLHKKLAPGTRKSVVPAFRVNPKTTEIGTPTNKHEKVLLEKLQSAINLGADSFPDPFTSLWHTYSETAGLVPGVQDACKYITHWVAARRATPLTHSVLDCLDAGNIVDVNDNAKNGKTSIKSKTVVFNDNFDDAVASLRTGSRRDDCKAFVFSVSPRVDDESYDIGIETVSGKTSRGGTLLEKARKHYAESALKWFVTYFPKL